MARCECCGWGEIDLRNGDGGEVCESCMVAMENAQTGQEDTE